MNVVSAGLIVIGDEVLSGKTQDTNTQVIAKALNAAGIQLTEARTIADDTQVIVKAVKEFSATYDYVFTTGGIGPTHDDITAVSIAEAVNQPLVIDNDSFALLRDYYQKQQQEFTEARQKMAKMPKGAEPIPNPVSMAPGFRYENIYVMAGVPRIMKAMLANILPTLQGGVSNLSYGITTERGESFLAAALSHLQQEYPDVSIGSYPRFTESGGTTATIVVKHHEKALVLEVADKVRAVITTDGGNILSDDFLE
jgi:molybdenum cofactor synthesis domain-containing protein